MFSFVLFLFNVMHLNPTALRKKVIDIINLNVFHFLYLNQTSTMYLCYCETHIVNLFHWDSVRSFDMMKDKHICTPAKS